MGAFSVAIEYREGEILVRPWGELDVMTAPTLEQALLGVIEKHRAILVDLSGVPFADCAGLRPLRRALEHGASGATSVRLVGARPKIERVLSLTGLRQPSSFSEG